MLVGLVRAGLATAEREVIKTGGTTIEVVRVRITAAGRRAIESEMHRAWVRGGAGGAPGAKTLPDIVAVPSAGGGGMRRGQ